MQNRTSLNLNRSRSWLNERMRAFTTAIILMTVMLIGGTFGYSAIEGWGLFDSLYMTIITLSTVGYSETHALSLEGRYFTSGLIVMGVCVVGYSIGTIGRTVLTGEVYKYRGIYKMQQEIAALENHIIVCGFGRLAHFLIPELRDQGEKVVVIENQPEAVRELEESGYLFVEGNAFEDETLISAGVKKASALLSLVGNDGDNILVTLCARDLNPRIRIMARTELINGEKKLHLAGANHVISPLRVSSSRILQQLTNPYVNDFLEILSDGKGNRLVLEQLVIPKGSKIVGQTIEGSELRKKTGATIAACTSRSGIVQLNPDKDTVFTEGSTLVAIGSSDALKSLADMLG